MRFKQSDLTALEALLVELYPQPDEARRLAVDAELDVAQISFQGSAAAFWSAVVEQAVGEQKLRLVVRQVGKEHKSSELHELDRRLFVHRKVALLIDAGGSSAGLPALPWSRASVDVLAEVLRRAELAFTVHALHAPTNQALADGLSVAVAELEPEDLLLLYYVGNILVDDLGALYLTASDTPPQPQALNARALSFGALEQDYLGASDARTLLVLDARWSRISARGGAPSFGGLSEAEIGTAIDDYLGRGGDKVVLAARCEPAVGAPAAGLPGAEPVVGALAAAFARVLEAKDWAGPGDPVVTARTLLDALQREKRPPLHRTLHTLPEKLELRGQGDQVELRPEDAESIALIRGELERKRVIPFLGDGVYGNGALSFSMLARDLAPKAGVIADWRDDRGLATSAESLALRLGDRQRFLDGFSEVLRKQSARCEVPPAYDLLRELPAPWLAVTVNYDDVLERRLDQARLPYVVVSHVLRVLPEPGESEPAPLADAGDPGHPSTLMLVKRSQLHPAVVSKAAPEVELRPPDDLGLREGDERIVYKLLGAPWLNELSLARERRLDTVVVTEADHIDFLIKLRGRGTGVPTTLVSRWFRTLTLLFLEYHLDVWHYRLIGHVFRAAGSGHVDGAVPIQKPWVVRAGPSPMERRFWDRFNPNLVSLDLDTVVRELRAGEGEEEARHAG